MPNDRVQLRPPRRLLAASGDVCSKLQNSLLEKAFDIRACIIECPLCPLCLILAVRAQHRELRGRGERRVKRWRRYCEGASGAEAPFFQTSAMDSMMDYVADR